MKRTKQSGITLIALVIIIIILLILAGVSIATLTGQNGILTRANEAKIQTEIAEEKELIGLAYNGAITEKRGIGYVTVSDLNAELEINETKATAGNNGDGKIRVTFDPPSNRTYTIDSNGKIEGPTTIIGKTDGSYDMSEGVNTPKLKDNMQLVIYDNGNWIEDTTKSAYKYKAQTGSTENGGTNEWANAVLDGNYYVWIPRYAYKIDKTISYTAQDGGTSYKIDVKFLVGTTNQYYDEKGELKEAKIATNADEISATDNTDYYVHPAFTFGDKQLEGIWIGKYECSDAGDNKIAIVPNASSLTNIKVSTMFSRSQTLSKTDIDAHMIKNIEWGAVAYLTQSQYGRNGTELSVNQCSSLITGAGKGIGENQIYNSTYRSSLITDEQRYNGNIGVLSSTTGNVYGVYDMSGGASEYVMGVYGTSSSPSKGSSGFSTFPDSKYYNLYTTTSVNNTNIGDALYETNGWNDDSNTFVKSSSPFLVRGHNYSGASEAGIFRFIGSSGSGGSGNSSFRVCLTVQ